MAERPATRREFLYGKSAAEALAALGGRPALPPAATDPTRAACTLTLTRRAMACEFQVQLVTDNQQNDTPAGLAALDLVDELEDRLSVYREHSEIRRLNAVAQTEPTPVAPDLCELLEMCDRLHHATGGAFDATTGPLSRAWGFYNRQGRLPTENQLDQAMQVTGWRHVELAQDDRTMRLTKPGVEVNFNGIGKGYALDCAAELLLTEGVGRFLLHGGRSTLVARGNRPGGEPGWGIGLRHPLRPQLRLAEFSLVDSAFSTSGSATQGFTHNGKRYGHLLDPRTGRPAEGVHSVSVVAPTGAEADALSTAFYVMGWEQAQEFCEARPEVGALFVLPGKHASRVAVRPVNLPESCWRQLEGF
ncbi:MAG: FAD:protein FMN transferase [Planctomycetales bacterium]|nr:FAD:protein FMN transferase [Planctomycetales bacterium]